MDGSNAVWIVTIHVCDDGDIEVVFVRFCLHFVTIDGSLVIVPDSNTENVSSIGKQRLLVFEIFSRIISCSDIIFKDMSWGEQVMVIDGHRSAVER